MSRFHLIITCLCLLINFIENVTVTKVTSVEHKDERTIVDGIHVIL